MAIGKRLFSKKILIEVVFMMISPVSYIKEQKNKSYKDLLKEKNTLLKEISDFENDKISEEEYNINPSPDVIYQCNLLYLSKL